MVGPGLRSQRPQVRLLPGAPQIKTSRESRRQETIDCPRIVRVSHLLLLLATFAALAAYSLSFTPASRRSVSVPSFSMSVAPLHAGQADIADRWGEARVSEILQM